MIDEHVSVSALEAARLCLRKDAWNQVGAKGPEPASRAKGKGIHKVLEDYLRDGTIPDFTTEIGQIVEPGLHFLPHPPQSHVEVFFKSDVYGIPWWGAIDLLTDAQVYDHKSSSNVSKWAKTSDDLVNDLQANIYTHVTGVPLGQWTYFQTTGPRKVLPVTFQISLQGPQHIRLIDDACRDAEQLLQLRRKGMHPLELPPNPDACEMFGGCEYRAMCNLSVEDHIRSIMSEDNKRDFKSFMETVKAEAAKKGLQEASPPAATPTWTPPAQTAPASPPAAPWTPPAQTAPASPPAAPWTPPPRPAAPPPPAPAAVVTTPAPSDAEIEAALNRAAVEAQRDELEKPKRGRPPGSKNKPTEPAAVVKAEDPYLESGKEPRAISLLRDLAAVASMNVKVLEGAVECCKMTNQIISALAESIK